MVTDQVIIVPTLRSTATARCMIPPGLTQQLPPITVARMDMAHTVLVRCGHHTVTAIHIPRGGGIIHLCRVQTGGRQRRGRPASALDLVTTAGTAVSALGAGGIGRGTITVVLGITHTIHFTEVIIRIIHITHTPPCMVSEA